MLKRRDWNGLDWTCRKNGSGKVSDSKTEGCISRGRPKLRQLEDVEKDLREMKVRRWRQKGDDREEWESVSKEAKALRGSKSK